MTGTTLTITDVDGTTGTVQCNPTDCTLRLGNTVLDVPNGGFPAGSGGSAAGFQGNLTVSPATGLLAADDGAAVATPFTLTRVAGPA